jgi:hypothetical protein
VILFGLAACDSPSLDEIAASFTFVGTLAEPDSCIVNKTVRLRCQDVAAYLRDTLHLEYDAQILVSIEEASGPTGAPSDVSAQLRKAGFVNAMAIGFVKPSST